MRLGVDLDGTLVNNLTAFVAAFNAETGNDLAPDDMWDANPGKVYAVSDAEVARIEAAHSDELFANAPIFVGAAEALQRWRKVGDQLFIVTERSPQFADVTKTWLERNGIFCDELLFDDDKAGMCAEHHLSLFVDDCANVVADLTKQKTPTVLVDAPHNGHFQQHRGSHGARWTRMYKWRTFKVIADELLGEGRNRTGAGRPIRF